MKMKWMLLRGLLGVVISISLGSVQPSVTYAGGKGMTSQLKSASQYQYTDQLIVKYRDLSIARATVLKKEHVDALSATAGVELTHVRAMSGDAHVLKLPHSMTLAEAEAVARKLNADPSVEYVVPDYRMFPMQVPNDSRYAEQWNYYESAGGVNLPATWDITTGSASIVAAVIDTGLRPHADIDSNILDGSGRVVPGYDFIVDPSVSNDGNGRESDPTDPGDWCPGYSDSSWHGTHVAGTIGALSNNGTGVAGINWTSKILPVRVLGTCGGYISDIVDGMRWAAGLSVSGVTDNTTHRANVLNLSLGAAVPCSSTPTIQSAINEIVAFGAVVVVAAGNDSANASSFTPAGCNGVISVAATNRAGGRAYYSNYGATVKIAAPGGEQLDGILSTLNTGTNSPGADSYGYYQGTSMAAPHVTGIVSLMLSVNPALTPDKVLSLIQATARVFPTGTGSAAGDCTTALCGPGIINALLAVQSSTILLEDAVDNNTLSWTTGGNASWVGQNAVSHFGGSSARSGSINNSQSSWIETTVDGPFSVSFFQKVSSQATYDKLQFSIDGVSKSAVSGAIDWQQKWFSATTPGTHTLRWTYSKNASVSTGADAGWLDQVVVSPNPALLLTSPNGGERWTTGSGRSITWNAPAGSEKYSLYYSTNSGSTWTLIANNLTSGGFSNITYPWTVPGFNGNFTTCKIKVEAYNAADVLVGSDTSDATFTMEVVSVDYPNGGEILSPVNNPHHIDFTVYDVLPQVNSYSLYYSLNGGSSWTLIETIAGVVAPGSHSRPWTVPSTTTLNTNSKVKVELKNGTTVVGTDMNDVNFTISSVYSVSGTVTLNGKAQSGVTMTLSGASSAPKVTDVNGKYTFTTLPAGVYTVTAAKAGYLFTPASKGVTITTANVISVNFAATGSSDTLYSVSGAVTGAVTSGITMTLSGAASGTAFTDGSGNYSFGNLADGTYSITPSKAMYTFDPLSGTVTVSGGNATGADFVSSSLTGATYSLSGKVSYGTTGLPGVAIELDGTGPVSGITADVVTDAGGNYSVKGLKSGTYTLNISKPGYAFKPVTPLAKIITANTTLAITAYGDAYAVSGEVISATDTPVSGVTVTLNTVPAKTAITDANGLYWFSGVPDGTYTLTPKLTTGSVLFTPAARSVTVSGTNAAAEQFIAKFLYSVSGSVSYSGTKTGRVYINVYGQNGEDTGRGTSISAPGAFTIRGIAPGTYILKAFRDNMGTGARNASNPYGESATVTVATSNVTGKNIILTNPAPAVADAPANVTATPGDNQAVVIMWDESLDSNDVETAKSYKVYWHTDGTISKTNYTGVTTLAARDNSIFLHSGSGVTNGTTLYYIVTSISESGAESVASAPVSVVIGDPASDSISTFTVSGSISFPASATAPLYVGIYSYEAGLYFTRIEPGSTSPQTYTITGVADGAYKPFAFIDVNNNGVMDIGDTTNTETLSNPITVHGADTTRDLVLTSANGFTGVTTQHITGWGDDFYKLYTAVLEGKNLPVKVSITAGPNIPTPIDIGNPWGEFSTWLDIGTTRPVAGDTYTLSVTYQNNVTENLTATVTGVLDAFPTNVFASAGLTPTFSWGAPTSPPSDYTYWVTVMSDPLSKFWEYPDHERIGASKFDTSVVYNADGSAFSPLIDGSPYALIVSVGDNNRNVASYVEIFTASNSSGNSISGTVSGDVASGVTVTLSGPGNLTTTTDGSGNYSFTGLIPGLYTVTPSLAGYTFSSTSSTVPITSSDYSGVNFTASTAAGATYGISGRVTSGGVGLADVEVLLSGAAAGSLYTDGNGDYSFSVLTNGTYTITPSKTGYAFSPGSATKTISGASTTANFSVAIPGSQHFQSVSGTVSYGGVKTGRVYIEVLNNGQKTSIGTSIAAPGAFTIRGVSPGTYTVSAFMDHADSNHVALGIRNASNPAGESSSSFTVTQGFDVTGADITLTDPGTVTPVAPDKPYVFAGNGAAMVDRSGPTVQIGNYNVEIAESYKVYWGPASSINIADPGSYAGVQITPADGDTRPFFHGGLTNGSTWYYVMTALVNGVESAASPVSDPITIGPRTGTGRYTVSGSISFPTGTGTLYIGMYNEQLGFYVTSIPDVSTSPQAYSITGLPNGLWKVFAAIDSNNDGILEYGEPSNLENLAAPITVAGANVSRNFVLSPLNAAAKVTTGHWKYTWRSGDTYDLNFEVNGSTKLPVKVVLVSGPNVTVPIDIGRDWTFRSWVLLQEPTRPSLGDTYTFDVTYSDGTTEQLSASITTILDNFARSLTVSTGLTPTFTWTAPLNPPVPYTYRMSVTDDTFRILWDYPQDMHGMPSSRTSVIYNADGSAQPIVTHNPVHDYFSAIGVQDRDGNMAWYQTKFQR